MFGLRTIICYVCPPSSLMKQDMKWICGLKERPEDCSRKSSVKRDPALILANALCFKGEWNQKLDVSKTQFGDFYLLNGKILQVPSMTGVGYEENICRSYEGHEILKLPYESCLGTGNFPCISFFQKRRTACQIWSKCSILNLASLIKNSS